MTSRGVVQWVTLIENVSQRILDSLATSEDETVCQSLAHSNSSLDVLRVGILRSRTSLLSLCLGWQPMVLYEHHCCRNRIWWIAAHYFPRQMSQRYSTYTGKHLKFGSFFEPTSIFFTVSRAWRARSHLVSCKQVTRKFLTTLQYLISTTIGREIPDWLHLGFQEQKYSLLLSRSRQGVLCKSWIRGLGYDLGSEFFFRLAFGSYV